MVDPCNVGVKPQKKLSVPSMVADASQSSPRTRTARSDFSNEIPSSCICFLLNFETWLHLAHIVSQTYSTKCPSSKKIFRYRNKYKNPDSVTNRIFRRIRTPSSPTMARQYSSRHEVYVVVPNCKKNSVPSMQIASYFPK